MGAARHVDTMRITHFAKTPGYLLCLLCLVTAVARADITRALIDINERLFSTEPGYPVFRDTDIYERRLVGDFYQRNGYRPVWGDAGYVEQMLGLLESSWEEGLDPDHYHLAELRSLRGGAGTSVPDTDYRDAQFDMLLTDALILYARHLAEGKVDPRTLDSSWNYTRLDFKPEAVSGALLDAIAARQVGSLLERLKPDYDAYRLMRAALREQREVARAETFRPVPTAPVLRPGDDHRNVIPLRHRLKQLGYLAPHEADSERYDTAVEQAVRQFQLRNNLDVDGVVGRQSYEVLNISARERVDRLRINLDRLRWVSEDVSAEFILVNVAGYELYYFRNGALQWETPVMIGTIDTPTPIFRAPLRYLEFNPTWNVPRSILERSLFDKFRANPQFAVEQRFAFYDNNGAAVDPTAIRWDQYSASSFPYRVVQMPGPANAMGRVKFMFPNPHAVYLHDTPTRALFSRSQRAFSAGCIRVKAPLELARLLLDDPVAWSTADIQALLDSGAPRQVVQIARPVDVLLLYLTASPTPDGRIQYHHDVYQRDPDALAALETPPQASVRAKRDSL